MRPANRRVLWADAVWAVILTLVFVLSFTTPPFDAEGMPNAPFKQTVEQNTGGGLCIMRRATGLECGGCGLTRGFVQLGHGEWGNALELNPLTPVAFLWTFGLWIEALVFVSIRKRFDWAFPNRWRWRFYSACLVALLTLTSIRIVEGVLGHTIII